MSQRPKQQPPKTSSVPQVLIDTVFIRPPIQVECTAPSFANEVRVIGGADATTIHFYFVSPARIATVVNGGRDEKITVAGNTMTIEAEPVCRVSIPLTTAVNLLAALSETIVGGVPILMNAMENMGQRMQSLQTQTEKSGDPNG